MEQLHNEGAGHKGASEYGRGVVVDILPGFGSHPRHVLYPFEEHEIYDCCGGQASVYAYFPFQAAFVFKGEYGAGDKLHNGAEYERDGYRQEYSEYYRQGFLGVEQIAHSESALGSGYLEECHHKGCAKEFEHH